MWAKKVGLTCQNQPTRISPLIVDSKRNGLKATYVHTSSIKVVTSTKPRSYAEAAMMQHPRIETNLISVCRQMARCDMERDADGFAQVVLNEMGKAVDWQKNRGSKAVYKKVDYPADKKVL